MFSLNRGVALLTPAFTAGAALVSAYAAKHGLNLPAGEVETVEIAAATAAAGSALKWLHGHQGFERLEHEADLAVKYIESQEKIKGVPAVLEAQGWHEEISNLKDQVTEAGEVATRAVQGQAAAEQKAGVALTKLAHVQSALTAASPAPGATPVPVARTEVNG